jgi:corrinoid protein of di/trimethylamine methyltransferase
MDREKVINELFESIQEMEEERLNKAVQEAIKLNLSFEDALNNGLARGIQNVGDRFESGELFLPHLVMAGDLMDNAVKKLAEKLPSVKGGIKKSETIVIGTVKDDIHEIGKNIVALMLRVAGFNVIDIGVDVPVENFIKAAQEHQAQVIGASALLTTTQYEQKKLVEQLRSEGLTEKYKVIVGGGQVTQEWVKEIGADGYGKDAAEAVKVVKKMLNK